MYTVKGVEEDNKTVEEDQDRKPERIHTIQGEVEGEKEVVYARW